jgi:hypothetical protein
VCATILVKALTLLLSPYSAVFQTFFLIIVELILLCFPGPSETVRGSNFMTVSFYYFVLPFVPLRQKGGVIFIFDRECISKPVK